MKITEKLQQFKKIEDRNRQRIEDWSAGKGYTLQQEKTRPRDKHNDHEKERPTMKRANKPMYFHTEEIKLMPHEIEMVEAFARENTGCPDCKVTCYNYNRQGYKVLCAYVKCKIMSHEETQRERDVVICIMLDDRSRSRVPQNQWNPGVEWCEGISADPNERRVKENMAVQETQKAIALYKEQITTNPASRTYELSAAEQWLIDLFRSCADAEREVLMNDVCALHHAMKIPG